MFHKNNHVHVKLPNDSYVVANYLGTIQFIKNLTIFNVLYVPEFTFNLILIRHFVINF